MSDDRGMQGPPAPVLVDDDRPTAVDIVRKTERLFHHRFVTLLARSVLDRDQCVEWWRSAVSIQHAIYSIDAYYELNPTVSAAAERPFWRSIESAIRRSNGGAMFSVWKRLSDLRRYATVEARIHAFDVIDVREFEGIASLKASDVGIARELVWSYGERPARSVYDFWRCLDECAELIEDVADIPEDGRDWNFNFWLYSYLATGNAARSVRGASHALVRRLATLEDAYRGLPLAPRYSFANVFRQTLAAGRSALDQCDVVFTEVASGRLLQYGTQEAAIARAASTV